MRLYRCIANKTIFCSILSLAYKSLTRLSHSHFKSQLWFAPSSSFSLQSERGHRITDSQGSTLHAPTDTVEPKVHLFVVHLYSVYYLHRFSYYNNILLLNSLINNTNNNKLWYY